jgi:hypothetical protein
VLKGALSGSMYADNARNFPPLSDQQSANL